MESYDTYMAQVTVRMSQAPVVDIVRVKGTGNPGGIGEPATALMAPDVANALVTLTGKRTRTLPMTPEANQAA